MSVLTRTAMPRKVGKSLTEVSDAAAVVERWQSELNTARAKLGTLETQSGDLFLDDPDAAASVPKRKAELRDRIDVAEQALDVARERLNAAARAALRAEAAQYEPKITAQRRELAEHDARTEELLQKIEDHTGVPYREALDDNEIRRRLMAGEDRIEVPSPRRARWVDELERLERRRDVLLAVADGRDPRQSVGLSGSPWLPSPAPLTREDYPDSVWGPAAIVPAPAYLEERERAAAAADDAEDLQQQRDVVAAELDAFNREHPDVAAHPELTVKHPWAMGDHRTPEQIRYRRLVVRLEKLDAALAGARERAALASS